MQRNKQIKLINTKLNLIENVIINIMGYYCVIFFFSAHILHSIGQWFGASIERKGIAKYTKCIVILKFLDSFSFYGRVFFMRRYYEKTFKYFNFSRVGEILK